MNLPRLSLYLIPACVLSGCVPKAPPPVKPPVVAAPAELSPVGTWENNDRGKSQGKMIFKANGELAFQGGMEFYNPVHWDVDKINKKLILTMPQAPDPKLDIFKMYVGDGVQSFDRAQKKVTYHFDEQTTTLNIAGWIFSKVDNSKVDIPAEPTLR